MGRTFNISEKARNLNFGIETSGPEKTSMGWSKEHCFVISDLRLHLWSGREKSRFGPVQSLSCIRLFANPRIAARQASLSITNSRSSLRLMSIESVMPSSHLILCHPLLLLPPIPPSIRGFSNESTLHEVAKVLEFQLYQDV